MAQLQELYDRHRPATVSLAVYITAVCLQKYGPDAEAVMSSAAGAVRQAQVQVR